MTQYRITSADFIAPGESLDPDCYIDPDDLNAAKQTCSAGFVQSILRTAIPTTPKIIRERKYDNGSQ